jgi:RNA polymerase sigma-70 factor (ECF subfamily)
MPGARTGALGLGASDGPTAVVGVAVADARDDDRPAPSLEARALRGERAAWNALIARHDRRVVVARLARGVRIDRARDLAQEAWLRLIEQQRRGALAELALPGLAITQAAFLLRDQARRDAVRARGGGSGDGDDDASVRRAPDPAPSSEERLLSGERLARAAEALEQCPRGAQRVFRAVYEHPELSHAEVAARVGLSVQRVRQVVCEVRARLRAAIERGERDA